MPTRTTPHHEQNIARIMNTLAHPRRVRIFQILMDQTGRKTNHGTLAKLSRIADPSLSHHLRVLETGGLIRRQAVGNRTEISLTTLRLSWMERFLAVTLDGTHPKAA